MLHRLLSLCALGALSISSTAPSATAGDRFGPGWGFDDARTLPPWSTFAVHDTLADGRRVIFDGSAAWIESETGTILLTLGATAQPVFPSFIELDPSETFVVLGENSSGVLYRVPLTGGGLVSVTTLVNNFDLAFESSSSVLVSAATCGFGCGNSVWRVNLIGGAPTKIADVTGPSGPLALSPAGALHYALQSDLFPTPPGAVSIVRWTAAQIANGPFPLGLLDATTFVPGLNGATSIVFDPDFGNLFVAESSFGNPSQLVEFAPSGARIGRPVRSPDYIGKLEVHDAIGSGAAGAFQPAGRRVLYRSTDFVLNTSRIGRVSPRRPQLASVQHMDGTMTLTLTGGTPNTLVELISGNAAAWNPVESAHDQSGYRFWTGMPYPGGIRRAGVTFPLDATGQGTFTFQNGPIQGMFVLQAIVRDALGASRGSSTAAFN